MRSKKPFSGCCVEMVKDGSFIVKLLLLSCFFLVSKGLVFDEMGSLLAFKNSSVEADPKGFLKSWSFSDKSPCEWSGVYCSVNGGITELNLTNGGLKGQIQISHLLALPSLVKLHFGGNDFYGNLSLKLQSSSSSCVLEVLDLSENNLSEPPALDALLQSCGHLSLLNLSGNSIPGGSLKFGGSLLQLDLSENKVSDFELLSYSLENCQNLRLLNFSGNSFSGKLNVNFSSCESLQVLDLSHNNFSGDSIGFGSCPNLTVLNLSYNVFSGFPSGLSSCLNLEAFDVGHNDMSLMIPGDVLGKLKNLKKLVLSNNRFFGEIPGELRELCGGLRELDLSSNQLSGGLPTTLASCSSLISLSLGHNRLSGDFLNSVVSSFKNLRYLSVSFNNITGLVPQSLENSTQLQVLDLSSNGFSGNVPSWLCSETLDSSLEKLMLSGNFLDGSIPPELGNCRNLKTIDLSFNFLTGAIPREIWTLPNLSDLMMWANSLSGEIPEGICSNNLQNLQTLILNNNVISGSLPESLANCTNLIWISLSGNRLSGSIPSGIGNLVNLAIFQLGNNSLSGPIPPEIGQCKSLIWLDLNSNNLSGAIPSELADQSGFILPGAVSGKKFAFVRNEGGTACRGAGGLVEFEGIRDERMANLSMVHSCPTTRIYSGKTVYTFSSNGSMIYLDLSYNSFSGSIPEKLGLISFIQVLNLGHNALTGTIPNTFGGLRSVGVLDLSHNNLHGSIPWPLGGLTFLNDFDVSNNNLSGPIPSGGQLTTFPSSRYQNNSGLCGLPLESCSSVNARRGSSHSGSRKQPVAVGIAIGIAFSLCTIFLLIFALYRISRRQGKEESKGKYIDSLPTSGSSSWKISNVVEPLSINVATFEKPLRKLTFAHLLEATNGFSSASLIGSGGFGEVYKAELRDGTIVAIKKLIHVTGQGDREFMAEMETIGKIKHRNLVPLLGYCKIGEERLLVYEYMKHGSLESVLHESARVLDWGARKKIAIGSARGLAFLHHSCIPHIIHRDMKSSNVLIDEDFQARVSDFGMARLVNALDTHLSVSTLAGTPGYVPPEYYQSFRCTAKGDVYSYGVILLELLSGKKPIDTLEFGDDNNLVGWAKQLHREKRIREILDREIVSSSCLDEVLHYLSIAFQCLDDKAFRRPTMIQVMAMFKDLQVDSGSDILDGISVNSSVIDEMQEKDVS